MTEKDKAQSILQAHREHGRNFREFKFVYPVVSRRARGISVGINTNPDKVCNFDCVYCQVNRSVPSTVHSLDTEEMREELLAVLQMVVSGDLFKQKPFDQLPHGMRVLRDVALSGDAEPTTIREFSKVVEIVISTLGEWKLSGVKIVLITDAGGLDRPDVIHGLRLMDANNGEVWAKLDAGTEEYFKTINRTTIPFDRILGNITAAAKERPIVIQSLFLRLRGQPPTASEIDAYCQRLNDITEAGGKVKLVQIYTVARPPAESFVTALSKAEVDRIAQTVSSKTSLPVEAFYGV